MAKGFGRKRGLRKTGRRSFFKSRIGFRGSNSRAVTAFTRPSQYYLPVPNQFRAALTMTYTSAETLAAGATYQDSQQCLNPLRNAFGGFNYVAEYLSGLLSIYSRGSVVKIQVHTELVNSSNGVWEAASGIIPFSSFQNLPAGAQGINRLSSHSDCKTSGLGTSAGGHDIKVFEHSVDLVKFLNSPVERDVCFTSTQPGVITLAPLQLTDCAPTYVIQLFNRSAAESSVLIRRRFTFHINFMDRHAAVQAVAI